MGKSKSTRNDGINDHYKTQEVQKTQTNIPKGFKEQI